MGYCIFVRIFCSRSLLLSIFVALSENVLKFFTKNGSRLLQWHIDTLMIQRIFQFIAPRTYENMFRVLCVCSDDILLLIAIQQSKSICRVHSARSLLPLETRDCWFSKFLRMSFYGLPFGFSLQCNIKAIRSFGIIFITFFVVI